MNEHHFRSVDVGTTYRSKCVTRVSISWNTAIGIVTWITVVGTKRTNQHANITRRLSATLYCTYMSYVDLTEVELEKGCITDSICATVFIGTVMMCRHRWHLRRADEDAGLRLLQGITATFFFSGGENRKYSETLRLRTTEVNFSAVIYNFCRSQWP